MQTKGVLQYVLRFATVIFVFAGSDLGIRLFKSSLLALSESTVNYKNVTLVDLFGEFFDNDTSTRDCVSESDHLKAQQKLEQSLLGVDYINVTSSLDTTTDLSFGSSDGCSFVDDFFDDEKNIDNTLGMQEGHSKQKHRGLSIQEQLSADLLALGVQAILKRKYKALLLLGSFSFEKMSKCIYKDRNLESNYNNSTEYNFKDNFLGCCVNYIPNHIDNNSLKNYNKKMSNDEFYKEFCSDLEAILSEVSIAFKVPFKWLPMASEKISFLSKLKISGSKNLVNNKKYCHSPRKTLDIVFDVDQTLLEMVPVFEVPQGRKSIMLEMFDIPQELREKKGDFKFQTKTSGDSKMRYNIPHEVHLNPQTIGLLFSLYYRRFLDPCVGSISVLSAGFNTNLKFANSIDIEGVLGSSRLHVSDTLLEIFPNDNDPGWATERTSLMAYKENRITSVQIPSLTASDMDRKPQQSKPQKFIRSFEDGFRELVYNGLPYLVKDMQRFRLHSTLQKGSSSLEYKLLSDDLEPGFLNTLRFYQTMKRYPILTHPFNSPKLFSNNRPLSLLVDDELLHFTYACSLEAWSDNVLIAWTEKLGPREIHINYSRYYLPIPLQHNVPKPLNMGTFSRNLNMMMNLDYFEGLTLQIGELKSLDASNAFFNNKNDKSKNLKGDLNNYVNEDLKDMEQFLSSVNDNELDWSGNILERSDNIFNIKITNGSDSITPSKFLHLVYPDGNNLSNMFSCPYDISNVKLLYLAVIIPCELMFVLYNKLEELNNKVNLSTEDASQRNDLQWLIKIVDMFIVINEKRDKNCDSFISLLSGTIAYLDENNPFNRKVIYSSIYSLSVLKTMVGLPMYRTITIWIQNSGVLEDSQILKTEMEKEMARMQIKLINTQYLPLQISKQYPPGTITEKSVYDIENLIILEPAKTKIIQETQNYSKLQQLTNSIDVFSLLETIRDSIELSYKDLGKRLVLGEPNAVTSQGAISLMIYSICYGITIKQSNRFHLNVCNIGKPVFSRPVLRKNQLDWFKYAFAKVMTGNNIKMSFPITRAFEKKYQTSIFLGNKIKNNSSTLFQPYFVGLNYKLIKHPIDENASNSNQKETIKKSLTTLNDDLLYLLLLSLASIDYKPFFVRQCITITVSLARFHYNQKEHEFTSGLKKVKNEDVANFVCEKIRDYLSEHVPEFFKI
ncbi:hypothetical protein FG386_000272 [Cryptosporidium ryanae]|uniref:uncharacterized protein n=1 Tax=Cryptosporidium ryanae TaxID=515981 RepID=UPI00351AA3D7|nr:hypothetical protein FG386_000272 [Cryptosporidium ryanae]